METIEAKPVEIMRVDPGGLLSPAVSVEVMGQRYRMLVEFVTAQLKKDIDYGIIPGSARPTLLKPGAEKLNSFFGLVPTFADLHVIEDFDKGLFFYRYKCRLWRGNPEGGGMVVAEGVGSCTSHESKYRYRRSQRKCPVCGKDTIRLSAHRDKEWYCWRKLDGCGATFAMDDEQITSQRSGRVVNPDIADQINTIDKMAQKRALIAATLIGCNASEFFTQDLDDLTPRDRGDESGDDDQRADGTESDDQRPHDEQAAARQQKPARGKAQANKPPPGTNGKPGPAAVNGGPKDTPSRHPASMEPAGPVRDSYDLRQDAQFLRALIELTAKRLNFDEPTARGLLSQTLNKHRKGSLADCDVDWRSSLIDGINAGLFDRLKRPALNGAASGNAPSPAPVPISMPTEADVNTWDKFRKLWDSSAAAVGWSPEQSGATLRKVLGRCSRLGREEETRPAWRVEKITALREMRIDPASGAIADAHTGEIIDQPTGSKAT